MTLIESSLDEEHSPVMNVGDTLSGFTPSALPFVDTKKKMHAKREHVMLRHGDATVSSSARSESSSSKRRRTHGSEEKDCTGFPRDEAQRCEDVSTPACHDFSPSLLCQTQEAESDVAILPNDQCKMLTFGIDEVSSLEGPLNDNVVHPSPGIYAQSSDVDEKPEDWPTDLLTELSCVHNRDSDTLARSSGREEGRSPLVDGDGPPLRRQSIQPSFCLGAEH
ncbi:hypothetical protein V8D89_007954 [Ganoderma adspersum]